MDVLLVCTSFWVCNTFSCTIYAQARLASSPDAISTIISFLKNGMSAALNSNWSFTVRSFPRASASIVWHANTPQSEPLFCWGVFCRQLEVYR